MSSVRRLLLSLGAILVGIFLVSRLCAFCVSNWAERSIQSAGAPVSTQPDTTALSSMPVDFSLWGKKRVQAYLAYLPLKLRCPIAVLQVPRLGITAPVYEGTDELSLNLGLGHITETDRPGGEHNLGVAGHRDGFFRALKDIRVGDEITVIRPDGRDTYAVQGTSIVEPTNVTVLNPTSIPTITLVTCYPFYFIGDAPQRFVVKAEIKRRVFAEHDIKN